MRIKVGIDIGSLYLKAAAETDDSAFASKLENEILGKRGNLLFFKPTPVKGRPISAAVMMLEKLLSAAPQEDLSIQFTGSQAQLVSRLLGLPWINEFKALARGCVELAPETHTILEIGGDGSRFLQVEWNVEKQELSISDYSRNGECAAGTGSFIDQQAARMNYAVEEIGRLVIEADGCANIAGRCSVFAKSDMVHAQQRGYPSGAIFKGLCEAVVRNFKGTVVRGRPMAPLVVMAGGVAANDGVVQAVKTVFGFRAEDFRVLDFPQHASALGCALLPGGALVTADDLQRLSNVNTALHGDSAARPPLDTYRVHRRLPQGSWNEDNPSRAFLGIDVGSVSTNLALIDQDGRVIDEVYTRTEGRPIQVVQRELAAWEAKYRNVEILGVGTTGSGRELIGELVGADVVHDEITAHKTGACFLARQEGEEEVDTIFEIGGQDSKFISLEDGVVVDFAMNEACAAGTGSFLEEQAVKLGISIQHDFARLALESRAPIRLGERCTVFMEKDVGVFMQQGRDLRDICAGLAYAVVYNYLNRVVRGRKIGRRIYFQGGTAYNLAVAAAFSMVLNQEITIPPHNGVLGAVGAALLARERYIRSPFVSRFRGFDLTQVHFRKRQFFCKACSNQCDIQEIIIDGEHTYWGDKCTDRYRKPRKMTRRPVVPDLFALYRQWLDEDLPAPDGLGMRIGLPRAMYYWDRFPFWRAYFGSLGAEIVLSEPTTVRIAAEGREMCVAEPCFPVVIGHGHFVDMRKRQVDFIFLPLIINSETEFPQTESWACPWGQTLPLMIGNNEAVSALRHKLLMPILHFRDGIEFIKRELHATARRLGASKKRSDRAVEAAYRNLARFRNRIQEVGRLALRQLEAAEQSAVLIVGRPYNVYDPGANLHIPEKLREWYGINVLPMDFLPLSGIDISNFHKNMFWNYGRRILQACRFAGQTDYLQVIYFSNFKCGPDSYIKHFVRDALGRPALFLQFDDHSNDAGMLTRCEAFLQSNGLLQDQPFAAVRVVSQETLS